MKPNSDLELETPLAAHVAAEAVLEEAQAYLNAELPRAWIAALSRRAQLHYANHPRFRKRLRSSGDKSREWLYAFMRHWLAARILKARPDLHAKLPDRYNVGEPLTP